MHIRLFFAALPLIAACTAHAQDDSQSPLPALQESSRADGAGADAIAKRAAAIKSTNIVRTGFTDNKGDLWFGTNQGVYRYDGKSFTHLSTKDGLSDDQVTSIMQDRSGNMWFGVRDGLCRFDGNSFTHIPIPHTESSTSWLDKVYPIVNPNQVMCMLQDRSGAFWIGTNGAGAYRYDGEAFTSFLAEHGRLQSDGLHHNIILNVTEDTIGNIWFTSLTHGGVSRFDGTTMRHFKTEDGLSDNMVRSAFADKAGNVWFGSNGNRKGCLDRFDGETFTNFKLSDGLSSTNLVTIFEDSKGLLWFGSLAGSLCTFDGESFATFTTSKGRTFDAITFITEDAQANIWFGGLDGQLFRHDGKTLTNFSIVAGIPGGSNEPEL